MSPRVLAATLAVLMLLVGCGVGANGSSLRIAVPTPPGGGFDMTARTLAATLEETGLAGDVEVLNLPGDIGMTALTRVGLERGDPGLVLQMGLGLVANSHIAGRPGAVTELTPLVRLLEEPEAIVVPADSGYRTVDQLLADLRQRPGDVTAGGGSYPGGPDHLALMLLAREIGLDPASVQYTSYDGGGDMLAALLSGQVDFATTGAGEHLHAVRAGELRVLAVTGSRRIPGIDAPTLREVGVDLEFLNWRGLLAPPDISDADRDALVAVFDELRSSASWREAMSHVGWADAYLSGDEFGEFLVAEDARVREVLAEFEVGAQR